MSYPIAGNQYFTGPVNEPSTVSDLSADRISVSNLTVSTQVTDELTVDNLVVSGTSSLQGAVTMSDDLVVSGTSSLQGAVTITVLGDYPDDTIAAAAGVPLNGLYRLGNAVQQRLV